MTKPTPRPRGHYPKGVRRHKAARNLGPLLARMQRLITDQFRQQRPSVSILLLSVDGWLALIFPTRYTKR